jgi:hypothetical protein
MTKIILMIFEQLIYVYILLIGLRIVFSWFKPSIDGKSSRNVSKLWHYLCLITGPYLALFSRFKMLRSDTFDFSPVIAVFVLLVASQIVSLFAIANGLSFNHIVIIIVLGVWEALRLILIFFLFLCSVRLIGIFFREARLGRFLNVIDLAIQPLTSFIIRVTHKKLKYQTILILCIGIIAVICIAGSFSFQKLYSVIARI